MRLRRHYCAIIPITNASQHAGEEPAAADANLSALETYLRQVFDRVDTGGDGEISVVEAIKALRTDDEFAELLGFEEATRVKASDGSKDRLTLALAALDSDGDKCVSWEEFRRAALGDVEEADAPVVVVEPEPPVAAAPPAEAAEPADANVAALEAYLREVFERVDASGDGAISVEEAVAALRDDDDFAEILGVESSRNDVLAAIRAVDADGDARRHADLRRLRHATPAAPRRAPCT